MPRGSRSEPSAFSLGLTPASTSTANIFIDHQKLRFVAAKPPPSHVFTEAALPAAEESGEYF
jgi:hypothetical protein